MDPKSTLLALFMGASTVYAQFSPRAAVDYFAGGNSLRVVRPSVIGLPIENKLDKTYFRVRIGGEYKYRFASAYFDQHVYMNKSPQSVSFAPNRAEWYAGIKFRIADKVSIKVEHLCIHPVLTQRVSESSARMYGGYDMVSLSYGY